MKKHMIVFYSRRGENHYDGGLKNLEIGNTERVAGIIAETLGCGSFRVERAVPYAESYRACVGEAVAEWKAGARPEIEGYCDEVLEADVIFVGWPIWCGTMPMPLYTFLEHYGLSGKTIVPFCTHEGSGYGSSLADIAKLCPGAQIAPALEVKGCKVEENRERIVAWARENA